MIIKILSIVSPARIVIKLSVVMFFHHKNMSSCKDHITSVGVCLFVCMYKSACSLCTYETFPLAGNCVGCISLVGKQCLPVAPKKTIL